MDEVTQPLTTPGESFEAYLRRHHLSLLAAARLTRVPASLVWRMVHRLPVSEHKARLVLDRLAARVGARYRGGIVVISPGENRHAFLF